MPYKREQNFPQFKGAQGIVYKATLQTAYSQSQCRHSKSFAIKVITLEDAKTEERLEREIEHLTHCDHPNVLKLREVYIIAKEQWRDRRFLVTEPWAQNSLYGLIKDIINHGNSTSCPWYIPHRLHPWPCIVKESILGIQHLHRKNIKHKDLNPNNILLHQSSNGDVHPIIADFGISKKHMPAINTSLQGTFPYLAPEKVNGEASTPETDVWCLGCCFTWIHAILSSKPCKEGDKKNYGISRLEELHCVGFAHKEKEVVSLLKDLRMDTEGSKDGETIQFLITLEDMIERMLDETPCKRPKLESLLKQLGPGDDILAHEHVVHQDVHCWSERNSPDSFTTNVHSVVDPTPIFSHLKDHTNASQTNGRQPAQHGRSVSSLNNNNNTGVGL